MNYKPVILLMLIFFLIYFSTTYSFIQAEEQIDGKALFENKCSKCHPLSKALSETEDLEEWKAITLRMSKKKNSDITPEDAEIIAEYLGSMNGK